MSTRAERRKTTERAILEAGLKLLAAGGQEALTVRGLARELDLVPSALYRYVANRDDLLTLLINHAYSDMADAVEAAHDAVPIEDLTGRWRAFARSLRAWTLEHPHEWVLIHGTPVRDYVVPMETTTESITRLHLLLVRLGADAEAANIWPSPVAAGSPQPVIPGLKDFLTASGLDITESTALAGLAAWHLLMGSLYSEQFRQFGTQLVVPDFYYQAMVAATERILFTDTHTSNQ